MEYKGFKVKEFLIVVFVMFVANCAITVIDFAVEHWTAPAIHKAD